MDEGIFSTYRQGENRVTASILAVLRSLVLSRIEHILGALLGEECTLVSFVNQPAKGGRGVPDAKIIAKALILLETKTQPDALKGRDATDQLRRHLDRLGTEPDGRVLVLTPDNSEPALINEIDDKQKRLVWASFADLNGAINELLGKEKEVISEREEFLLRELQKVLEADGLLGPAKGVVVVAARIAWPEYQKFHAYILAANRSIRPVKYIAFYSEGQIQATVPAILSVQEQVLFQRGLHAGPLGALVHRMLDEGGRPEGVNERVYFLSAPDDVQTIKLDQAVKNNLGRAFVQGKLYVALDALCKAKTTSDLVGDGAAPIEPADAVPPSPKRVEFGR